MRSASHQQVVLHCALFMQHALLVFQTVCAVIITMQFSKMNVTVQARQTLQSVSLDTMKLTT